MAKKKLKIGVLFGGKSAEHEVSLQSAKNVINFLDKKKYEIIPIGIDKNGKWLLGNISNYLLNNNDPKLIKLNKSNNEVILTTEGSGALVSMRDLKNCEKLDVIFPVLHGPFGEDGSMQGFLKLAGIPFIGPSVLGSAVGMDKDVMKRLFREAGIPIGKFIAVEKTAKISFKEISKKLGLPLFIKPANLGSSVGIHKVKNEKEFYAGLKDAFQYDNKVVIEENINGREIECSVLGNENPLASLPGEIISNADFYSYNSKYIDDKSVCKIPAELPKKTIKEIQMMAVKVFKTLSCEGMGRVDFFVTKNNKIIVNEINTLPGFTAISMYPKMWEASGLSLPKLLDKLIDLAIARFKRDQKLKTTV
ncbi:MAG: D-alanine--D-alanine ligase [bacterium]